MGLLKLSLSWSHHEVVSIEMRADLLPDLNAIFRTQEHLITLFQVECLIEGRDVSRCPHGAEVARRMRVGHQTAAQLFITVITTPYLRPTNKQTLFTG